jgi:hypothetical protein
LDSSWTFSSSDPAFISHVFGQSNIEIDVIYLNPKYTLSKQTVNVKTGEGLLKMFEQGTDHHS